MTEIGNNPFSQFNMPQAPMYKQNNASVQNNIAPKEQTTQPNKKQSNLKDVVILTGTTATGVIGGIAAAEFDQKIKNENTLNQIKEHKAVLLDKFKKNSDVQDIADGLLETNNFIKAFKERAASINEAISNETSPEKINRLKENLEEQIEVKEHSETDFKKLSADFDEKYANLVTKPYKEFKENLIAKTAKHNETFAKIALAIGALVGLTVGGTIIYVKNKQKEEKNESINTVF